MARPSSTSGSSLRGRAAVSFRGPALASSVCTAAASPPPIGLVPV